jgi:hypothetical protein
VTDLIAAQLTDLFRIGIIIALFATMLRTEAATGRVLPLAAGVIFVAVLIPATQAGRAESLITQIGAGLVSNLIILGLVIAAWTLFTRLRR